MEEHNSVDKRDFGFLGAKGELTAHLGETHTIRGGLEWRWSRVEYDYVCSSTATDHKAVYLAAVVPTLRTA